jgi:hypothetical protein
MASKKSLSLGAKWASFRLWIPSGSGDVLQQRNYAVSCLYLLNGALFSSVSRDLKFSGNVSASSFEVLNEGSPDLKTEVQWVASTLAMSTWDETVVQPTHMPHMEVKLSLSDMHRSSVQRVNPETLDTRDSQEGHLASRTRRWASVEIRSKEIKFSIATWDLKCLGFRFGAQMLWQHSPVHQGTRTWPGPADDLAMWYKVAWSRVLVKCSTMELKQGNNWSSNVAVLISTSNDYTGAVIKICRFTGCVITSGTEESDNFSLSLLRPTQSVPRQ